MIKYLLKAGANTDIVDTSGQSALRMLFDLGPFHKDIVEIFEEKLREDSPNDEDIFRRLLDTGLTMYEAAHLDDLGLMQFMLDRGLNVSSTGLFNLTALHAAVEQNDLQLAAWLIGKNADVSARDEDGFTPLLLSVVAPLKKGVLKLLLEHDSDPNIGTYHTKESPLFALAIYEEPIEEVIECMQLLFEYGAIPHNLENPEKSIFDGALSSVSPKRVKYLIARAVLLEKMGTPIDKTAMRSSSKFKHSVGNHRRVLDEVTYQSLSLFDLLTASDSSMRRYGRDRTFIPKIQRFCRKKKLRTVYPYYCDTLVKRIDKAADTVKLEDIAVPIVCGLFHSNNQPRR